ncbi:pro-pol protein [Moniliophthora roreri MCA 2997]|uniref:Pro-pol protein n=1 Tax=Moniliophthora roreri (strain MCA 2997) TaxID=1381753 RepID=V2X9T4_MONRO|nr:pro-pol protein [Moniliophthora roreri MCA 2997]
MHPSEYDTDEKKCLFLLSYLQGKDTQSWKQRNTDLIFNWKSGDDELKWEDLKNAFKKHYLPADIKADVQLRIEDMKMGERADNYVNKFRGLPFILADKILNQPQGRPKDLNGWYEAAIRFDEQYKYAKAVQKPRRFQMAVDKKKKFEKKETAVNWLDTGWLSEEDRWEYMKDGRCFRCAKQGHLSRDCPMKNSDKAEEQKEKRTPRDAYVKIQALFREYSQEEQTELLDIMEKEGLVIRPGTIGMDPVKLAGIEDWPAPETVTGVRSFTGFANFYHKSIGRYAEITKPLYDLTKKGVKFVWNDTCQAAFTTLKQKFSKQPLLKIPDFSKPFVIEADTSKWASGAVPQQKGDDGEWHPCVHVPGSQMVQSDVLSRQPDHVHGIDTDNEDVIMLLESLFVNMIDVDLQNRLKTVLGIPPIKSSLSDWKFDDNILFYKGRAYVPNNITLQRDIIQIIHEGQPFGHPGQYGTVDLVGREFWWPGMAKFIKAFVDGCAPCQQMKINTHPSVTGIMPLPGVPNTVPFQVITMDLITDLPESDGSDSIMVVVDHSSTKGVTFIPCTKKLDATKAAELLFQHVYKRYGLAERIISDRDPRFVAEVFQEMARLLGIKHSMSTAYHPQTDGETERVNQEVEIYLRFFCGKQQMEWSKHLHMAEFAHNNRTHSVTHHSPFFMTMGYHPRPLPTIFKRTDVPLVEKWLTELKRLREETSAMIEVARRGVMEQGKKKRDVFEKGQKVWLEEKNLDFGYSRKKLSPKREGLFIIEEVMGPVTYKLKLPKQWRIHPVFHVGLLSLYKETEEHGANFLEPPPDIIEGHEEFEIEAIIGHKPRKDPKKFLVSWKGFDSSHNEWKKKEELEHAMELYLEYIIQNKL